MPLAYTYSATGDIGGMLSLAGPTNESTLEVQFLLLIPPNLGARLTLNPHPFFLPTTPSSQSYLPFGRNASVRVLVTDTYDASSSATLSSLVVYNSTSHAAITQVCTERCWLAVTRARRD